MFQYACAKSLQLRLGACVKLDAQQSQWHARHQYELDHYSISLPVASIRDVNYFCSESLPNKKIKRLEWLAKKSQQQKIFRQLFRKYLKINILHPDLHLLKENPEEVNSIEQFPVPAYLDGYWQNPAHFQAFDAVIRTDLTLKTNLGQSAAKFKEKILSHSTPVSIHFRRGDYLSRKVSIMFRVLSLSYYKAAMKIVNNSYNDVVYIAFSDDIPWVKQEFKDLKQKIIYIDGNHAGYEDLHLMSLCHHHIIANSTFSWWGAWLSNTKEKLVIAPRQWGLSDTVARNTSGIIPADWIRI